MTEDLQRQFHRARRWKWLAILLLLLNIGTWLWVLHDRVARRAEAERQARQALQEADRLLNEERWAEALLVLAPVGPVGGQLGKQVDQLRRDVELLRQLEEIRLPASQPSSNKRPTE
jgi:hypothetical protein